MVTLNTFTAQLLLFLIFLFNDELNTFYLQLYGVGQLW